MAAVKSWFRVKGKHLVEAFILLLFTIVGGTMPVWGGALLVRASNQWQSWSSFCFGGEFAIYSAALLAPILYVVNRGYKRMKIDLLQLLIVILLLASAILFAGVKARQLLGLTIDKIFIRDFTIILFIVSIILYYLIHYFEYSRVGTDLKKARDTALRSLEKKFDKLGR